VIRSGRGALQAERMARCASVGSADWTTVPAVPVRVTAAMRSISRAIRAHVSPVACSATRTRSSVLEVRPVYHRKQDRIKAHVTLCFLDESPAGGAGPDRGFLHGDVPGDGREPARVSSCLWCATRR
jgi:hypothetical protein